MPPLAASIAHATDRLSSGRNLIGALDQLPAKLRAYGKAESSGYEFTVLVVVDADDDNCLLLKKSLVTMYDELQSKPSRVLFRIAVEETESWFIADTAAVKRAFSGADLALLKGIVPDKVCGAWEQLAKALGREPKECTGSDKVAWAKAISLHLGLESAKSPSLRCLVSGIQAML